MLLFCFNYIIISLLFHLIYFSIFAAYFGGIEAINNPRVGELNLIDKD